MNLGSVHGDLHHGTPLTVTRLLAQSISQIPEGTQRIPDPAIAPPPTAVPSPCLLVTSPLLRLFSRERNPTRQGRFGREHVFSSPTPKSQGRRRRRTMAGWSEDEEDKKTGGWE
ncbi:hypothetical protein HA466_0287960 [Hirschfeldia incana]|nr:hypothetical protein HA466_0287960 [Hirschfeldia incana]